MGQIVLCVESGGSKTLCSIHTSDGELLGWGQGGSARLDAGSDEANPIAEAIAGALGQSGISAKQVTLCAASVLGQQEALAAALREYALPEQVLHYSDAIVALVSALSRDSGIVALSGTGSFVYGRNEAGEESLVGGHGYLLGDDGSGFDIGLKALKAVLRWMEGWGEDASCLAERIEREWLSGQVHPLTGFERSRRLVGEAIERYPMHHFRKIARLSRLVGKCAAEGDALSRRLIEEAGVKMGMQVAALGKNFRMEGRPVPIGLAGGNWKLGRMMTDAFQQALHEHFDHDFTVVFPQLEPLFGVLLIALQELGIAWSETLLEKLNAHSRIIRESLLLNMGA